MVEGWPVAQVRQIVEEALHELIQPLVYTEALHLIAAHKAAGREVVIISSSGEDVVAPIGRLVGADRVIATRVRVESGRYTSDIEFYAYGAYKAAAMREIAAANGYDLADCYAYSDSATDAPMLDAVGHPTAVNPDRALRRLANQRNWPIAHFGRPRRIRPAIRVPAAFRGRLRMPAPVTGRLAASLAAVLALGAGGAIFVARRAPAAHAHAMHTAHLKRLNVTSAHPEAADCRTSDQFRTEPRVPSFDSSTRVEKALRGLAGRPGSRHGGRELTRDQPRDGASIG